MIEKLDKLLASKSKDYYRLLQPGVRENELSAFENKFSIVLPNDFKELYIWRDGQDPMSSSPIQDNRTFMTLKEIESTKEELDGMIGYDFEDPKYWRASWVPFLENGGGSYLCLDVAAEDGGAINQLIGFWKRDSDRPIEYKSISEWLQKLTVSIEDGTIELC